MGLWDSLAFWKKKDDFDFDFGTGSNQPTGDPLGQDGQNDPYGQAQLGGNQFGQEQQNRYGNPFGDFNASSNDMQIRQSTPTHGSSIDSRDMEILNSKLDAIKSALDAISQRLNNVERIALESERAETRVRRAW